MLKYLFLFIIFTVPLTFSQDFRLRFFGFSAPIVVIFILAYGLLLLVIKNISLCKRQFLNFILLLALIFLSGTYLMISYTIHVSSEIYLSYILKYLIDCALLVFSILIAYGTNVSFNSFLLSFVISSMFWVSMYIYQYLFVFKSPFLGNSLFNYELTTLGKNQFQFYIATTLPIIFLLLRISDSLTTRLVGILALIIYSFALIYIGSKAGWLSSLMLFAFLLLKDRNLRSLSLKLLLTIFLGIVVLYSLSSRIEILSTFNLAEAKNAFLEFEYILLSSDYDESFLERKELITIGITNFAESPLIGRGLGYLQEYNPYGKLSHCDYIFFLSDLGLIGISIFLLLFIYICLNLGSMWWITLPLIVDLAFINATFFPLQYIIYGLIIGYNWRINEIFGCHDKLEGKEIS